MPQRHGIFKMLGFLGHCHSQCLTLYLSLKISVLLSTYQIFLVFFNRVLLMDFVLFVDGLFVPSVTGRGVMKSSIRMIRLFLFFGPLLLYIFQVLLSG